MKRKKGIAMICIEHRYYKKFFLEHDRMEDPRCYNCTDYRDKGTPCKQMKQLEELRLVEAIYGK